MINYHPTFHHVSKNSLNHSFGDLSQFLKINTLNLIVYLINWDTLGSVSILSEIIHESNDGNKAVWSSSNFYLLIMLKNGVK